MADELPGPLVRTPEQAAAIIGGTCKPSLLRKLAREKKIPSRKIGGAYNFTDADIDEIIAYFGLLAQGAPSPAKPAKAEPKQPAPDPVAGPGVVPLRAREPRRKKQT